MGEGTVERAQEARAVADLLTHAQVGPASLVVDGEAGIGKTTLILDAVAEARALDFRVLQAQGAPTEVTYAYAAVADLLRDVDDEAVADLPELQRLALQRACVGEVESGGPATDERTTAIALMSVIERLAAQGPVLVVVDDAQWLDASSRAVIGFVTRRLAGPVGMLLSFRTGDPGAHDDRAWLRFHRPEAQAQVHMRPLGRKALHALVADRLGHTLPRPLVTRIHEISGGNPLFAIELARGAADDLAATSVDLPDTLVALVRRRIGHVDEAAAAVLLAAACSAAPTVEVVAQATDTSTADVVAALESIEHLHAVVLDGDRVRFAHPLFATGIYTDAAPSRRRAMHRKLAGIVERPEVRARHLALAAATGDATMLAALDAAAETTIAQGAPAVAAELLELAMTLGGDDVWRRIRAGELHFRAGSFVAARERLRAALAEAPPGALRCMALMWLGGVMAYDDDMAGAVEVMSEAVDEVGDNPALGLLCRLRLALALVMTDRVKEALRIMDDAVVIADRMGEPALRSQARSVWVAGSFIAGRGVEHEALRTAVELEDPRSGATTFFRASAVEAMIHGCTGELDRARDEMLAVLKQMLDEGTEVDIIWAAAHVAQIELWSGRYPEATRAAQEALERAEQMDGKFALITASTLQCAVAAYAGREAEARSVAQAAVDASYAIGAPLMAKDPRSTLAFLEVSRGEYAAALTTLQPDLDSFDGLTTEIEGGRHLPDAIEALTSVGRTDEAEPLIKALEHNGIQHDRPWMLAVGSRGRGQLFAARGDLDEAQRAVEQAMVHHERLPMPFEKARTQLLLGQLQRRRRRRQDAAAALHEALETFERLGAPLWVARARAEIGRLDSPRGDGQGLTAAEQRTARLAAEGRSNKQIAAELFISEKTVEMYLSAAYRKLGVRSRAGLSAALER
ncbi:LuxR C-terminal-related transcriptional regulator [Candidatus Mycobacterium wuenschmannii]|uniref:LuxR C-terminal-related transcriptional regulator n=1 Tax=Candidatus Mycobacterium wuenschmannii TaxID=3027808 RepID=A0ABY8VUP3_9MYCO|nr:LuxR family transcriptional regulator [Candidatus Mycobacterium wuenschmannii]WIM87031.1 LuxR C-terminal-related transcriptional regulator [Candidatus Mycobacterium wuenschmannii]